MEPFISIVMPVYNVEKYVGCAVESVLNQSFQNYELILIDDCSTDRSGLVCDSYAEKDRRIHVIHKAKNEGLDRRGILVWKTVVDNGLCLLIQMIG